MTTSELLVCWNERMKGRLVRGQRVAYVELHLDCNCDIGVRAWLGVVFDENPNDPKASPEQNLVARVFDEKPGSAQTRTMPLHVAEQVMSGERELVDAHWMLDDETELSERVI